MDNSRLIYSTEAGRVCPKCQKPVSKCRCKKKSPKPPSNVKYDGKIRIQREKKGRKGKTVTTITGFQQGENELKVLAALLKRRCGTGGSVKDGIVIASAKVAILVKDAVGREVVLVVEARECAVV